MSGIPKSEYGSEINNMFVKSESATAYSVKREKYNRRNDVTDISHYIKGEENYGEDSWRNGPSTWQLNFCKLYLPRREKLL